MEDTEMPSGTGSYVFKPFCFSLVPSSREKLSPKPRSGHRLVSDSKGNLYCYGGYNPTVTESEMADEIWLDSQPLFRELWKYNFASARWFKIAAEHIPEELASCCLFYYNDCVTVFGGTGFPFGAFSSNTVAMCDVKKKEPHFELLPVYGELPSPQYGQGFILDDPFFYTVGGTNGYDYSSDIHRLDLRNGLWELIYRCTGRLTEPYGRYRHELAFDGERIYLLGGGTVGLNACLANLPVFHLTSRKWDVIKSNPDPDHGYPNPRKYHSCVQLPGELKFLVIGGFDDNDVYNDCWLLNLNGVTWKYLSSLKLPLGTYFHGSAVTPSGKLYTFGGVHHHCKQPERTSSMFSAWLKIPSLKEMCWDAFKYYKFTKCYSKSELRLLGVPLQYIDEVN